MTNVLILGALAFVPTPQRAETVLPLRSIFGLWAVRARYREREGYFILATERLSSAVSAGYMEGRSGEKATERPALELGTFRMETIPEGPMDRQGVVGALGADFFQGKRITFDLDRRTVVVAEGKGTSPKDAKEVPAHLGFDGPLGIDLPIGGKPTRLLLASGSYRTGLFPVAIDSVDAVDAFATNVYDASSGRSQSVPVRVGRLPDGSPVSEGWFLLDSLSARSAEAYPSEPAGFIALPDLGASRVTLDFAREVLVLESGAPLGRESRLASQASSLPVSVTKDALRIGDRARPLPPSLGPYDGFEITAFGDVDANALLKAFQGKSDADRALVAKLAAWGASAPKTLRVKREDRTIALTIDEQGRLTAGEG